MLADCNLLVAFTWENHPQTTAAHRFFSTELKVVTCPLTELALVRIWMQLGATGAEADAALENFVSSFRSQLLPADLSATAIAGLSEGHRQTTDCYLAMLARQHKLKVATLDQKFAERFPDVVHLVA